MDLTPFLVAGKGRDWLDGFHPQFRDSLAAMFANAPPEIRTQLRIASGFRSNERQAQLYQEAVAKYGSPEAARKWVAPPGRSNHNHGKAADLKYLNPAALEWAHANAGKYGLAFPLKHENWHIEPAGLRGGSGAPMTAVAQNQPPTSPMSIAANFAPPPAEASMGDLLMGGISGMKQRPQVADKEAVAQARKARQQALFDSANLWA